MRRQCSQVNLCHFQPAAHTMSTAITHLQTIIQRLCITSTVFGNQTHFTKKDYLICFNYRNVSILNLLHRFFHEFHTRGHFVLINFKLDEFRIYKHTKHMKRKAANLLIRVCWWQNAQDIYTVELGCTQSTGWISLCTLAIINC